MSNQRKTSKIWRATSSSQSGIMVQENTSYLIGNKDNFVAADDHHVSVTGSSIVLNTTSENLRNGGFFVKLNDFTQMVPTTLVTPMPNQIPFPPLGFASNILKDLPFFLSFLGG